MSVVNFSGVVFGFFLGNSSGKGGVCIYIYNKVSGLFCKHKWLIFEKFAKNSGNTINLRTKRQKQSSFFCLIIHSYEVNSQ